MLAKQRLVVALLGMPERGVPGPASTIDVVAPGNRVIPHVSAGVAAFVHRHQHVNGSAWIGLEIVPFVRSVPWLGQRRRGRMVDILNLDRRGLDRRMAAKVRADELTVPGPTVLGVGRRMDAHVSVAALDVALEGGLLIVFEKTSAENIAPSSLAERRSSRIPEEQAESSRTKAQANLRILIARSSR